MLNKLAIKNIRHYIGSYIVYLVTVSFSSWAFCTFTAFSGSSYMDQMKAGSRVYGMCLEMGSWVLLAFAAIFVWYSTDFFFQQRKQEFGMYMLMGIKRRSIYYLLIVETVIIGMAAVCTGMFASFVTSLPVQKAAAAFIGHDFGAEMIIPVADAGLMLLKYLAVFLIFSVLNCISMKRCSLADLFKARNIQEKPFRLSIPKMAAAFIILAAGFVMIFNAKDGDTMYLLPIGLGAVIAGTFMSFLQGTAGITGRLRVSEFCASNLSNRVNMTGIMHRLRRNASSWASISLLIAASVSLMILVCSVYQSTLELRNLPGEAEEGIEEVIAVYKVLIMVIMTIGAALLSSTGSIIYFRTMSDLREDRSSMWVLHCIGADRREFNGMIRKRVGTMFMTPLASGIIYSLLFAVYVSRRSLLNGIQPVLISISVYALIYLIYYLISACQGRSLINETYRRAE